MPLNLRFHFLVLAFILAIVSFYRVSLAIERWEHDWKDLYKYEDFNHYYATGYLMSQGIVPYDVTLNSIKDLSSKFVWHEKIEKPTNPPLLGALFVPISYMSPFNAWLFWNIGMLTCLISSVLILFKIYSRKISMFDKAMVFLLLIGFQPVLYGLYYSQVQPLFYFLSF